MATMRQGLLSETTTTIKTYWLQLMAKKDTFPL